MPYTLTKGLLWFLLALLIGIVIGWLLRSIRATSQLRAMRAVRHDSAELDQLRGRVANLEPVVAERDRLRAELAARGQAATNPAAGPGAHAPSTGTDAAAATTTAAVTEPDAAVDVVQVTEVIEVVALAPDTNAATTEAPGPATDTGAIDSSSDSPSESPTDTAIGADTPPAVARVSAHAPTAELEGAAAVLGTRVARDDLTAIEGIGPTIAGLCHGIGITTWAELADTEVSLLRTMLADAGPGYSTHRPDTWPQQARLLAAGRWEEFRNLVSKLDSGELGE
jgi:predicted flap endonuclease-1-like 5' DNA nuclease